MRIRTTTLLGVLALTCLAFILVAGAASAAPLDPDVYNETMFNKNMDVWFMLMLVAFLMLFIRKFEWGICLAVLLVTTTSFVTYMFIDQFFLGKDVEQVWNMANMIMAVVCSITVVIAIGVFLGTIRMWQYLVVGIFFGVSFQLILWVLYTWMPEAGIGTPVDPGGSILVHMLAAYWGWGVILALREKRAFNEPMYITKHSTSFVWMASMLLFVLWPSFVTGTLDNTADITMGTITCYMAGIGSLISAYIVCQGVQKKVNPLIYTYAMLAGPVAIGSPLLAWDMSVAPWAALALGLIAGAISALSFIFLQPWLCKKAGVLDVMGVHNLHGVGGWLGAVTAAVVVSGAFVANVSGAILVCVLGIVTGGLCGVFLKVMRKEQEWFTDDTDFIDNPAPKT
ncbi:MAG: ammonium transporter [Methanomassiliicoccus sp.]|nr:MAG: ammonium transporter [Methanomassiliicoccus sp.]